MPTDTLRIEGTTYTGVTGIKAKDTSNNTYTYIKPQGTVTISSSGTTDVTEYASATVASGTEGTPTATKGTVSNHAVSVTPSVTNSAGYISGGSHSGTPVSVLASELVSGTKSISSNGTNIDVTDYAAVDVSVPTGTARSSSDLTVSGATVTAPAGLYSSSASASVASGTAGTPTASKGSVSNHAVSVTPSVTNTTGYITGSTKTGTAVSVSASELVSGTKSISSNGTGIDVTNYASVDVAVPVGTSKAIQYYNGGARVAATSYTATTVELTVAKAGTYTIMWSGFRSSTSSGTNGSRLYKNDDTLGSAYTSFTDSYWQAPKLTGQVLAKDDVLTLYARSSSNSRYMCVCNLIIIEE